MDEFARVYRKTFWYLIGSQIALYVLHLVLVKLRGNAAEIASYLSIGIIGIIGIWLIIGFPNLIFDIHRRAVNHTIWLKQIMDRLESLKAQEPTYVVDTESESTMITIEQDADK